MFERYNTCFVAFSTCTPSDRRVASIMCFVCMILNNLLHISVSLRIIFIFLTQIEKIVTMSGS